MNPKFSTVIRVSILAATVVAIAWAVPAAAQQFDNLMFLHHSTGAGLVFEGDVRGVLAEYNTTNGTNFRFWDHGYNGDGITDPDGNPTGTSYDTPDDNTDPDGLYNLFMLPVNLAAPDNALSLFLANHKVFAFKSCFPASAISDNDMLEQYKTWYRAIRAKIDQYPDHVFIPFSTPPLTPLETNAAQASRARAFANWLKGEFLTEDGLPHPNIFPFDFFDLLAKANDGSAQANMLRAAYRPADSHDSHPNTLANETNAPYFVNHLARSAEAYSLWRAGRADYSGDARDELGVFRAGMWFMTNSPDFSGVDLSRAFGSPAGLDDPQIAELGCLAAGGGAPDGRADIGFLRVPFSTYQATLSSDYGATPDWTVTFGTTQHKRLPLRGFDTNHDGCSDIGVFRNGCFHVLESPGYGAIAHTICFGLSTDVPLSGDVNGDGVSDLGLWRPSSAHFTFATSPGWTTIGVDRSFGVPGDVPIVADVSGDGIADLGVYRKSTSTFFFTYSPDFAGVDLSRTVGAAGDVPVVTDVNGDRRADLGVFRKSTAYWSILCSPGYGAACVATTFGAANDTPIFGIPAGF